MREKTKRERGCTNGTKTSEDARALKVPDRRSKKQNVCSSSRKAVQEEERHHEMQGLICARQALQGCLSK